MSLSLPVCVYFPPKDAPRPRDRKPLLIGIYFRQNNDDSTSLYMLSAFLPADIINRMNNKRSTADKFKVIYNACKAFPQKFYGNLSALALAHCHAKNNGTGMTAYIDAPNQPIFNGVCIRNIRPKIVNSFSNHQLHQLYSLLYNRSPSHNALLKPFRHLNPYAEAEDSEDSRDSNYEDDSEHDHHMQDDDHDLDLEDLDFEDQEDQQDEVPADIAIDIDDDDEDEDDFEVQIINDHKRARSKTQTRTRNKRSRSDFEFATSNIQTNIHEANSSPPPAGPQSKFQAFIDQMTSMSVVLNRIEAAARKHEEAAREVESLRDIARKSTLQAVDSLFA